MLDAALAAGLGVAVAVLFAAKAPIHSFVSGALTDAELRDGLILAIATLIVWPQVPDRYMGPFEALNPHILWLLVVLVLAIGAVGHMAARLLGARYGLPLAGFASGFVSSTATIGSMAGVAADRPESLKSAIAGAVLSTVATFLQMALLLFVVSPQTLLALAPALTAGAFVSALYGLMFTLTALKASQDANVQKEKGRAFSIFTGIALSTTFAAMLVAAAALKSKLGEAGIIAGAGLAGFVDTHAAAISVASLTKSGALSPSDAVFPILAAMSANALAKVIMAFSVCGRSARKQSD